MCAAVLTLLLGAAPASSVSLRQITWDDVAAPLQAVLRARGVDGTTFPARVAEIRRRNQARVREGDLDHLVYYLLQSTTFTNLPPIEPAVSAAELAQTGGTVPRAVGARIDALVTATAAGQADERMTYFRAILEREAPRAEARTSFLLEQYARAMRFFGGKKSYEERGLSTDTSVEAGYASYLALATLRSLEPQRRIRRVLIVGPGLDLAPRTAFVAAGAPQSSQPFAVIDALLGLGLSRRDDLRVTALDINPRVVEWVGRVRGTKPRLTVVSGIEATNRVRISDEYRDYFWALGDAIGRRQALPAPPAGRLAKSVTLQHGITDLLDAALGDVVLDRLDQQFDLVVVTNVFPYFSDSDLLLAMTNIVKMLAPDGVVLHNEPRPVLADATLALGLPLIHARSAVLASTEGRPPFYDAVWMHRRGSAAARVERRPLDVARALAARYPESTAMSYIPAVTWSASARLARLTGEEKWKEGPRRAMRAFISGEKPAIAEPHALTSLAGHLALADFGSMDGDAAAAALARKAADFMLPASDAEIVRFARGWTDDMFMATSVLARVAARSHDKRYPRTIGRLLISYADRLQRADGLFIHSTDGPHAWGRGNGFAALGLVEALTYLPESWPERRRVLEIYDRQMRALLHHQAVSGAWRQVVDEPASYEELTVTAMTVAAMARGVRLGWLAADVIPAIERGWSAVLARVSEDGSVRDVCASTGAGPTKEYYLQRPALSGADDRGGGMALLAALEVEQLRRK